MEQCHPKASRTVRARRIETAPTISAVWFLPASVGMSAGQSTCRIGGRQISRCRWQVVKCCVKTAVRRGPDVETRATEPESGPALACPTDPSPWPGLRLAALVNRCDVSMVRRSIGARCRVGTKSEADAARLTRIMGQPWYVRVNVREANLRDGAASDLAGRRRPRAAVAGLKDGAGTNRPILLMATGSLSPGLVVIVPFAAPSVWRIDASDAKGERRVAPIQLLRPRACWLRPWDSIWRVSAVSLGGRPCPGWRVWNQATARVILAP
jgi:hypothetical protein